MSNGIGDWISGAQMKELLALLIALITLLITINGAWSGLRLLGLSAQASKLLLAEVWTFNARAEAGLRKRWSTLGREYSDIISQLMALEGRKIGFLADGVMKPFQAMHAAYKGVAAA